MHKKIWKNAAACLLAALMFPGCSDDEGGGPDNPTDRYRTLVISINSLDQAEAMGTRADETVSTEDDSPYEHYIENYWLIVLRQSETGTGNYLVDRVIDSNDTDVYVIPNNNDNDSRTDLELEVEIGATYRFLALANLDGLQNADAIKTAINGLTEGQKFDATSFNATLQAMSNYTSDGTTYIPMSSYWYQQTIAEGTDQLDEDIALIRLIGKVTLEVTNLTENPLTLKSLSMGQFRSTGSIYLFPYDVNGGTRYLLQEGISELYNPTFPTVAGETPAFTSTTFVSNDINIAANETEPFTMYVNETGNSSSDLMITTEIADRNNNPVASGFSFVRRNDWLRIPIQVTNVESEISFNQQHMPIGGLPEALTFGEVTVPIATCTTTHGGEIEVDFSVTSVSGLNNSTLKIYTGPTYEGNETFTSAVLTDNNSDGEPFLIAGADGADLPTDNTNAPWLDASSIALPITAGTDNLSGSFTVTAQELANKASATVALTLVVQGTDSDGNNKEMTIPYTVIIQNKE